MSEGGAVDERTGGSATDPGRGATQAPGTPAATPAAAAPAAAAPAAAAPAAATPAEGSSPPPRSDAVTRIEGLADDLLPALIGRLESSALGELEVRTADWRVRLSRSAGGADQAAALALSATVSAAGTSAAGTSAGTAHLASAVGALAAGGTGAGTAAAGSRGGAAVAAPHLPVPTRALAGATGTSAPGQPGSSGTAMVHVAISPAVGFLVVRDGYGPGRAVHAGEVVGQVDCLGVMRDVTAPEDGVIARNLAEQGEAVEYGQPLFDIEPGSPQPASRAPEGR